MANQEQLDLRKKWVEALRSEKYKQGKGYLRQGDSYCCLGVLCEVAGLNGSPITSSVNSIFRYGVGKESTSLPKEIMKKIGIDSICGHYLLPDGTSTSLAIQNDDGKTFDEIADIIERAPKPLFRD